MRRLGYEIFEAFKIAVQAIRANKARGFLTTLGIVIGITAVSTTMTVMVGMKNSFQSQLTALGTEFTNSVRKLIPPASSKAPALFNSSVRVIRSTALLAS